MSEQVYALSPEVTVTITVHDPDVLNRVLGPEGEEWRSQFYPLHTLDDVLNHLAFNAISNGVSDISRLEGWADLDSTAVTFELDWSDGEAVLVAPAEDAA